MVLFRELNISFKNVPIIPDPDDPDDQTLLMRYPSVNTEIDNYVTPMIKIEAGAKSALEPHQSVSIQPFIADEIINDNLIVPDIITIKAERTFWDKIVILHGLRRCHDDRGQLRHEGHCISRHY